MGIGTVTPWQPTQLQNACIQARDPPSTVKATQARIQTATSLIAHTAQPNRVQAQQGFAPNPANDTNMAGVTPVIRQNNPTAKPQSRNLPAPDSCNSPACNGGNRHLMYCHIHRHIQGTYMQARCRCHKIARRAPSPQGKGCDLHGDVSAEHSLTRASTRPAGRHLVHACWHENHTP